jgi:hypothetical protein
MPVATRGPLVVPLLLVLRSKDLFQVTGSDLWEYGVRIGPCAIELVVNSFSKQSPVSPTRDSLLRLLGATVVLIPFFVLVVLLLFILIAATFPVGHGVIVLISPTQAAVGRKRSSRRGRSDSHISGGSNRRGRGYRHHNGGLADSRSCWCSGGVGSSHRGSRKRLVLRNGSSCRSDGRGGCRRR